MPTDPARPVEAERMKFVVHRTDCAVGFGRCEWRAGDAYICTCGLKEFLEAAPPSVPREPLPKEEHEEVACCGKTMGWWTCSRPAGHKGRHEHSPRVAAAPVRPVEDRPCICQDDGNGMALYDAACPNELHAALQTEKS